MSQPDSPLSIAASITGILTFVAAVVAGFYAHAVSLKNAIDTQAEVSSALEKIDFLETETDMLNNAYLASQIRHPERGKYGSGDFKYFHGLYGQSLERMRIMDRDLRKSAALIAGGNRYDKVSRVKSAAAWMTARDRVHKAIDERKAESTRIFQIQLAILSAKIDELSYHQNHHNVTCSIIVEELELGVSQSAASGSGLGSLSQKTFFERERHVSANAISNSAADAEATEANRRIRDGHPTPAILSSPSRSLCSKRELSSEILNNLTAISPPVAIHQTPLPLAHPDFSDNDYHQALKDLEQLPPTSTSPLCSSSSFSFS